MKIKDYLTEIEPAATTVIEEIHREERHVADLSRTLAHLTKATAEGYANVEQINKMDEYLSSIPGYQDDDPLLSTAIYWYTFFGVGKERHRTDKDLREAMLRLAAHDFARNAMSGSLLQFAKQGLSIRYGKSLSACPKGRLIGSQSITDVIWQGRNQAIHWEEGQFHSATEATLKQIAKDFCSPYDQYASRSLAYEIVSVLGWQSFADFSKDLLALDSWLLGWTMYLYRDQVDTLLYSYALKTVNTSE